LVLTCFFSCIVLMIVTGRPMLAERFVPLGFPVTHCMLIYVFWFRDCMNMFFLLHWVTKPWLDWLDLPWLDIASHDVNELHYQSPRYESLRHASGHHVRSITPSLGASRRPSNANSLLLIALPQIGCRKTECPPALALLNAFKFLPKVRGNDHKFLLAEFQVIGRWRMSFCHPIIAGSLMDLAFPRDGRSSRWMARCVAKCDRAKSVPRPENGDWLTWSGL